MADVIFDPVRHLPTGDQRVYLKEKWADDWTYYPDLHATRVVWSAAPNMPTANLQWLYGDVKQKTAGAFVPVSKLKAPRYFVRIEMDGDPNVREWWGVLEIDSDQMGGAIATLDTGRQVLTCYGLEKLLSDHEIRDAAYRDNGGITRYVDVPPAFNEGGRPNKAPSASDLFTDNLDTGELWSTRTIVNYLLQYQTPLNDASGVTVPFQVGPAAAAIATWDRPELRQEGLTTYNLLDQLLNGTRMLVWWLEVNPGEGAHGVVELNCRSTLSAPLSIPLPSSPTIPANENPRHLIYDEDQKTASVIETSEVRKYDRVLVRGRRRRSVGTFSITDGTIEVGWTAAEHQRYVDAASTLPGYPSGQKQQQEANARARSNVEIDHVYSIFRIPFAWDKRVKDGEGGAANPMFPTSTPTDPYPVYYPNMYVEQTLPLFESVDYGDSKIADGTFVLPAEERREMSPFACIRVPNMTPRKWTLTTEVGQNASSEITRASSDFNRWSASVQVPRESQSIRMNVIGAPRHVLNALSFPYLDSDIRLGGWAWSGSEGMTITLSIEDDRYCEGEFSTISGATDVVRTKIIWAGDGFVKDYVAPGTVVGIGDDGLLKRSTGGFIPKEAADDDEHYLIAAATVAGAWYTIQHKTLDLESQQLKGPAVLTIGDLVTGIGNKAVESGHLDNQVNSVVTQIAISWPRTAPDAPQGPRFRLMTSTGPIDPFVVLPPRRGAG